MAAPHKPAPHKPAALQAVTLFTEDLAAAIEFYRTLLRADPVWGDTVSSVFMAGPVMINLLQVAAVPELIGPAPMAKPGARAVHTLAVADVDAEAARLAVAGVALLNGPMDRPWGIRAVCVIDPSGHVWELAMPLKT